MVKASGFKVPADVYKRTKYEEEEENFHQESEWSSVMSEEKKLPEGHQRPLRLSLLLSPCSSVPAPQTPPPPSPVVPLNANRACVLQTG